MTEERRLGEQLGAQSEEEAREFEDVAAQLGLSAEPVEPSPQLKADLFAKLATTPQLPAKAPVADRQPAPTPDAPAAPDAPAGAAAPGAAERAARRRWFQRPGAILAAAAAAVVLFIGGAFLGTALAGGDSYQHQQASALAAINASSDIQRATAAVNGGGTATLVWSPRLGRSALIATDLPALPSGKTYELWYIRDGRATPAGTMDAAGRSATTWRVLTGEMAAGDTVGVTVEPSGGSKQPTTTPIVAIAS